MSPMPFSFYRLCSFSAAETKGSHSCTDTLTVDSLPSLSAVPRYPTLVPAAHHFLMTAATGAAVDIFCMHKAIAPTNSQGSIPRQ